MTVPALGHQSLLPQERFYLQFAAYTTHTNTLTDIELNRLKFIVFCCRTVVLPQICKVGDDGNYGSSAVCDAECLQQLSKRCDLSTDYCLPAQLNVGASSDAGVISEEVDIGVKWTRDRNGVSRLTGSSVVAVVWIPVYCVWWVCGRGYVYVCMYGWECDCMGVWTCGALRCAAWTCGREVCLWWSIMHCSRYVW